MSGLYRGIRQFDCCRFKLLIMVNWRIGRGILKQHLKRQNLSLDPFLRELAGLPITRIPGTGVFMSSVPEGIPPVLTQLVRRFRTVHERMVIVTVLIQDAAFVDPAARARVETLAPDLLRVVLSFGFREHPDVPLALTPVLAALPTPTSSRLTYLLGEETLIVGPKGHLGPLSEGLFAFLARNANKASLHYQLPPEQVIALNSYIDL